MAKRKLSKQQQRRIASQQKNKIQDDKLQLDESSTQTARVISHHGRQLYAETEKLEKIKCRIRQNLGDIACGDYVLLQQATNAAGESQNVVIAVKERSNLLVKTGFAGAIKPVAVLKICQRKHSLS
jgi:ribosome biogenesis GTPase